MSPQLPSSRLGTLPCAQVPLRVGLQGLLLPQSMATGPWNLPSLLEIPFLPAEKEPGGE